MSITFESQSDKFEKAIEERLGTNSVVCYSAFRADENGVPIDNLNEVAIQGKVMMISNAHTWYLIDGEKYTSEPLENPTWLDLSICADKMIRITGDGHHSFLENVHDHKIEVNGCQIYSFVMGS